MGTVLNAGLIHRFLFRFIRIEVSFCGGQLVVTI
jgi:hypothetical protein